MRTISKEELKELYDKDFPLWAEINLELLKEKLYELVDWENLLEEIQDMAQRHLDACISYLAVILEHIYKWDNFKHLTKGGEEKGGHGWIKSVNSARRGILVEFKNYPSLRAKLPTEIQRAWIYAKKYLEDWLEDNGYDPETFQIPEECPYTYEQAMTRDLRREIKP
ncbi:MAG: DUF29 domain-containing protein [Aquificaceae bacterium]|nr:DUF29 domain-containing protein [Aquificaceae bacterium]